MFLISVELGSYHKSTIHHQLIVLIKHLLKDIASYNLRVFLPVAIIKQLLTPSTIIIITITDC